MGRSLRQRMEKDVGEKDMLVILPHAFLPPRYRKIHPGKNLLLTFTWNFTVEVQWEGVCRTEEISLSPKKAAQLLREIEKYLTQYRKDIKSFRSFILRHGEKTPTEDWTDDISSRRQPRIPEKIEETYESSQEDPLLVLAEISTELEEIEHE